MTGGKRDDKKGSNKNADPNQSGEEATSLESIISKLNTLTNEANKRAASTDTILQTISSKVDKFTESISTVKEEVGHLRHEMINEKRENKRQTVQLIDLENKLEILERDNRRSNIILEGVPEDKDQSLIDILDQLLKDLQVNMDTSACDKIFRRGRRQNAKDGASPNPRPIVVVFLRLSFKVQVFKNLKNLAGIPKWNNIYLNDDFTPMQKVQISELRSISALARKNGMESRVRGNALFVDGRRYSYGDLGRLPEGLSITAAKTISVDDGRGIGFQSKHSVFSNMSEAHMVHDGLDFNSAEEIYQYIRGNADLVKTSRTFWLHVTPTKPRSLGEKFGKQQTGTGRRYR